MAILVKTFTQVQNQITHLWRDPDRRIKQAYLCLFFFLLRKNKYGQTDTTWRSWNTPPVRTSFAGTTSTAAKSPASFSSITCTHSSSLRVTSLHLEENTDIDRRQGCQSVGLKINQTLPKLHRQYTQSGHVSCCMPRTKTFSWSNVTSFHSEKKLCIPVLLMFLVNFGWINVTAPFSQGSGLSLNHSEVPQCQVPARVGLLVAVHFDGDCAFG